MNGQPVPGSETSLQTNQRNYNLPLDLTRLQISSGGRYPLALNVIDSQGKRTRLDYATLVVGTNPMRVTLRWDKANTDVDLHVVSSTGNHSWYGNLCGIPNGCLDRDDVDGFGPEVFTLTTTPRTVSYRVYLYYFSDRGNGPTTATVVVEVNGRTVTNRSVTISNRQEVESERIPPAHRG